MFESVAGSAAPRSRTASALAVAVALHAGVLATALWLGPRPIDTDVQPVPPRVVFDRHTGDHGQRAGGGKLPESGRQPEKKPIPRKPPHRGPRPSLAPPKPPETPEETRSPQALAQPSEGPAAGPATGETDGPGAGDGEPCDGGGCDGPAAEPQPEEIVRVDPQHMEVPRAACQPPAPPAPQAAQQFGIEGTVVAQFVVHADGRADTFEALNRDAPPIYADAVRRWLEGCAFAPARLSGTPVSVRMTQTFRFRFR